MPLLTNVVITTARSTFDVTTRVTGVPITYLQRVPAHIEPNIGQVTFAAMPEAALTSDYIVTVDTGVDVVTQDRITSLMLTDGVTPWPGDIPFGTNEFWMVTYHVETGPVVLPSRVLYIKRVRGGGPTAVY